MGKYASAKITYNTIIGEDRERWVLAPRVTARLFSNGPGEYMVAE